MILRKKILGVLAGYLFSLLFVPLASATTYTFNLSNDPSLGSGAEIHMGSSSFQFDFDHRLSEMDLIYKEFMGVELASISGVAYGGYIGEMPGAGSFFEDEGLYQFDLLFTVVQGANGDFFSYDVGLPLGTLTNPDGTIEAIHPRTNSKGHVFEFYPTNISPNGTWLTLVGGGWFSVAGEIGDFLFSGMRSYHMPPPPPPHPPVPEPASMALLCLGLSGLYLRKKHR